MSSHEDDATARVEAFLDALDALDSGRERSRYEPAGVAGIPGSDGQYHDLLPTDLRALLAGRNRLTVELETADRRIRTEIADYIEGPLGDAHRDIANNPRSAPGAVRISERALSILRWVAMNVRQEEGADER